MSITAIAALLQSALILLSLAQSSPNIPQSFRDNAVLVARSAITQATASLNADATSNSIASTTTHVALLGTQDSDCRTIQITDEQGTPAVSLSLTIRGVFKSADGKFMQYQPKETFTTNSAGELKYCHIATTYEVTIGEETLTAKEKVSHTTDLNIELTSTPATDPYDYYVLHWKAENATSCVLDSSPVLLAPTGSQKTGFVHDPTTFTLTCNSGNISATKSITIQPPQPCKPTNLSRDFWGMSGWVINGECTVLN